MIFRAIVKNAKRNTLVNGYHREMVMLLSKVAAGEKGGRTIKVINANECENGGRPIQTIIESRSIKTSDWLKTFCEQNSIYSSEAEKLPRYEFVKALGAPKLCRKGKVDLYTV
jgi:hypothetical protein